MKATHYWHVCSTLLLATLGMTLPTNAQVAPDGTLSTTVSQSGNNFTITNGNQVGNNLFHSFSQFSIPTGGSAFFNNATTIQNIFARVTGGSASNLDGLIRANGSANLFLLNPAGILFGANARLNLGGSFVGTTASSVKFADGTEFSAVNSTAPPLLTMSVPIGLQMGQNPGAITVQGKGNDGIVPTSNLGIVSKPGKTIALVGGDVNFSGGVITAPSGRIEIGAVNSGMVSLTPTPAGWQLGYAQAQALRDVSFSARSSLWNPYPISNPFGGIQVAGRDVTLNQSQIAAATTGTAQGGNITVNAARSLRLGGLNPNAAAPSAWIVNLVNTRATGKGGAVNIQAGQVSLQDGAAIETLSLGSGAAGTLQVSADTIAASGVVSVKSPLLPTGSSTSRLASSAYASGAGGDLVVAARQITLADSAQIGTLVLPGATGKGGNVAVTAVDLTASGYNPLSLSPSGVQAYTLGVGNGGAVNLAIDRLNLINSGGIFTVTTRLAGVPGTGIGNAGNITVTARDTIAITGTNPIQPDLISFLGSFTVGAGNSGNVVVTTPRLSLQAGGGLGTSTQAVVGKFGDRTKANSLGNAGNVSLTVAEQIEVSGINAFTRTPSPLGSSSFSNGNGGNVIIQTNRLTVRDGGTVTAVAESTGNAGALTIQANDILVEGKSSQRSSIVASAPILNATTRQFYGLPAFPSGDTGTVSISTDRLTIRDQGTISVQHQGTGNAGQLSIRANTLSLETGSIEAKTTSGQGGNINLRVRDLLLLRQGSEITATSGGIGNGGNIDINARFMVGAENSDIVANAFQGRGGNIQITTQGIFGLKFRPQRTPDSDITASSQFGVSGTVQINNIGVDPNSGLVELPANVVDSSQQIATDCTGSQGSSFIATGRGGVPQNPTQQVNSDRTWNDDRDLSAYRQPGQPIVAQPPVAKPMLLQATTWQRHPDGSAELLADQPATPLSTVATCSGTPTTAVAGQ